MILSLKLDPIGPFCESNFCHLPSLMLDPDEHMSSQAIRTDFLASLETVPSRSGQNLAPDDPVKEADAKDRPACDCMRPVREVDVWAIAWWRLDEGYDKEEDVRGAEESSCADGPVRGTLPVAVGEEVQVDDSKGDDRVDDREGVRNLGKIEVSVLRECRERKTERTELRTKL